MNDTADNNNQATAQQLSNNLSRLLREFSRDFEHRIWRGLAARGYPDTRPSHGVVFANLGPQGIRVTELAARARVTQQAMGKMLKELERLGYVTREVDREDKRAKEIRLTERGAALAADNVAVASEVRAYYADLIGTRLLEDLEGSLRQAVDKLRLHNMPEAWSTTSRAKL